MLKVKKVKITIFQKKLFSLKSNSIWQKKLAFKKKIISTGWTG